MLASRLRRTKSLRAIRELRTSAYFLLANRSRRSASRDRWGDWRSRRDEVSLQRTATTPPHKEMALPHTAVGYYLSLNFGGPFRPLSVSWLHFSKISSTTRSIRAVASITTPPFGTSSFVAYNRAMSSRSSGFPPKSVGSSATRSSIRRFMVSRSTSRINTPSNKSMNLAKFLELPQKKVAASSWLATKAFTFSTSQIWCSEIQVAVGVPVSGAVLDPFPDRLDTPIPGHHEWLGSRAAAILYRPPFCRRRKRLRSNSF